MKKGIIYSCELFFLAAITFSCANGTESNKSTKSSGKESTPTASSGDFHIGQSYNGGIIFFIDSTGQHGLIAAASDQSTGAPWGCYEISIIGTSTAIGSGQANSAAILKGCITAGIAACICHNLALNGYNDWFLPSKDELNQMYLNKNLIGGFAQHSYWSSSLGNAKYDAWCQYFVDGLQHLVSKDEEGYVRAIRAF